MGAPKGHPKLQVEPTSRKSLFATRRRLGAGQTRWENGLDWSGGEGESLSGPVVVFPEVLKPAAQQRAAHGQQVRGAFTTPEHTRLLETLPNHCFAASLYHARADEIAGLSKRLLAGLYKIMRGKSGREAVESAWADDSGCMT